MATKTRSGEDRRHSVYFPPRQDDRRSYQDRRKELGEYQELPVGRANHNSVLTTHSHRLTRDSKVIIAVLILAVVIVVTL